MEEYFESSLLDQLFQNRKINFKNFIKSKYGIGIDEEKETVEDEEIMVNAIIDAVGKEIYEEKIKDKINEFQISIFAENDLWNEAFYKLGFTDNEHIKKEIQEYKLKDISNVEKFEDVFDDELVETISNYIETKCNKLKSIEKFKEIDDNFNRLLEDLETNLSEDLKDKMNDLIKNMYQLESYYFTLAYFTGAKNAQNIKAL